MLDIIDDGNTTSYKLLIYKSIYLFVYSYIGYIGGNYLFVYIYISLYISFIYVFILGGI